MQFPYFSLLYDHIHRSVNIFFIFFMISYQTLYCQHIPVFFDIPERRYSSHFILPFKIKNRNGIRCGFLYSSLNLLKVEPCLAAEVDCAVAELFFDAEELVVLCNTVCAARSTCLDLTCVESNCDVSDCCVLSLA